MTSWREWLWVAVGSALGGTLRFGLTRALLGMAPGGIHLATLAVNVVGSAVFGWLMARQGQLPLPAVTYLGLTTGILGGFTTYSTFNAEVLRHALAGQIGKAGAYAAATFCLCLLGGAAGWWLALRGAA